LEAFHEEGVEVSIVVDEGEVVSEFGDFLGELLEEECGAGTE
jgi:hypothetical protein